MGAKSLKPRHENMLRADTTKRCVLQPAACLLQTMQAESSELHVLLHPCLQARLTPGQLLARVNQPIKPIVTAATEELSSFATAETAE